MKRRTQKKKAIPKHLNINSSIRKGKSSSKNKIQFRSCDGILTDKAAKYKFQLKLDKNFCEKNDVFSQGS